MSDQQQSDPALTRTVFVRPKDGKHLISVVHTLSLLSQLASKFGPIQHFHFPREPFTQRLFGYGSITFVDKESIQKALSNDGIHTVVLPPIVPSRAPRTYLSDKEHARLVGMDPLVSCESPAEGATAAQTYLSVRSLQNPAAMRPGWNDVAPLCRMEAAAKSQYFVDQSKATQETPQDAVIHHDATFYLSTASVPTEVKLERRSSAITTRPGAKAKNSSTSGLHIKVRTALQQFGGFSNVIKEQGLLRRSLGHVMDEEGSERRGQLKHKKGRSVWQSNRTPPQRRNFSTSAISPSAEQVKARRKAEWQRNRHSNFVDQLYSRLVGGKRWRRMCVFPSRKVRSVWTAIRR